jgi:branched-chain amino acid transport system substrate-binding protein
VSSRSQIALLHRIAPLSKAVQFRERTVVESHWLISGVDKVRFKRIAPLLLAGVLVATSCSSSKKASSTGTTTGGTTAAAADPGLTPTTITVGTVADVGGPVPGILEGAIFGMQAYAAYLNSIGGVNGRKLVIKTGDSALACATSTTAMQGLVNDVFAFVGDFVVNDSCQAQILQANPTLSNVSYALSKTMGDEPNNYPVAPQPPGWRTGPFQYFKDHLSDGQMNAGGLYAASGQNPITWGGLKGALTQVVYKVVYERATQPTETDFTADVVRMKNAGVQLLTLDVEDVATTARVLDAAFQQNWHPKVVDTSGSYDAHFFKLLANAGAAEGIYNDQLFSLFLGEDSTSTPEVKLFNDWMTKTKPGVSPDLFAMYGWASGALFTEAVKKAGNNLTRASLQTALKSITSFDDNGLIASADPAGKKPATCFAIVTVKNGKYVRVTPTDKGFTCAGGGYYYVPKS